jgi:hypothetical protein
MYPCILIYLIQILFSLSHAGASFAGAMAHFYSLETALMTNGALTSATMLWFAAKNRPLAGIFAKSP